MDSARLIAGRVEGPTGVTVVQGLFEGVHMPRFSKSLVSLFLLPAVFVLGCQETSPTPVVESHEHEEGHHHPETLAEALTELTELRDTIRDAFAKDDADKAHDPLHEVGHILDAVKELAEKEKLPEERLAAVKSSVEELFTAYGDVDKLMHGGEGTAYKDVSGRIDAAIVTLKAAITGEAAPAPVGEATPAASGEAAAAGSGEAAPAPAGEATSPPAGEAAPAPAPAGEAPKAE